MTADPARDALVGALSHIENDGTDQSSLENFVVRGPTLADADGTRFDLSDDMASGVADDVLKAVAKLQQKQFIGYDPSYQTNTSQLLVESLDQIPELADIDDKLRTGDVADDSGGSQVLVMAHAVGTGPSKIVAYRLKGPGIAARRAAGITLIPRDGVYRPVSGDVLYYEPRFDVFTCAGYAYFTTATLIQTKLHAVEKAKQLAVDTLADATKKVRIDGFDELKQAVMNDPTLRAKMAYLARLLSSEPDYLDYLKTKRLTKFVEDHPDYDIPIVVVNGKKALQFDPSPQHRHQIPRLLADDYLHSFLTDRRYEAGSKHRVST